MKNSISYLLAFITILLFTSSTSSIVRMDMGEPVPGAEIYVELEPDDEPIPNPNDSGGGQYYLTLSTTLLQKIAERSNQAKANVNQLPQYKLKFSFKIPAGFFESQLQKITNPEEVINAKFKFLIKVQYGKQLVTKNFEVSILKKSEISAKSAQRYGPVLMPALDGASKVNITLQLAGPVTFGSKTGSNPL